MALALASSRASGCAVLQLQRSPAARYAVVVGGKGADRKRRWRHNRPNSPYMRGGSLTTWRPDTDCDCPPATEAPAREPGKHGAQPQRPADMEEKDCPCP